MIHLSARKFPAATQRQEVWSHLNESNQHAIIIYEPTRAPLSRGRAAPTPLTGAARVQPAAQHAQNQWPHETPCTGNERIERRYTSMFVLLLLFMTVRRTNHRSCSSNHSAPLSRFQITLSPGLSVSVYICVWCAMCADRQRWNHTVVNRRLAFHWCNTSVRPTNFPAHMHYSTCLWIFEMVDRQWCPHFQRTEQMMRAFDHRESRARWDFFVNHQTKFQDLFDWRV